MGVVTDVVTKPLILASASPRRRELLAAAGIAFTPVAADIDESWRGGETPEDHCARLAGEKAVAVSGKNPGALVLGADTIVVIDEQVLGKPQDRADGERMLRALSGRVHTVFTAVALARAGVMLEQFTAATEVTFQPLSEAELAWYLATDEPWDKAGAYAAQGKGAALIARIEGDYFTVVGLPVAQTLRALQRQGVAVFNA